MKMSPGLLGLSMVGGGLGAVGAPVPAVLLSASTIVEDAATGTAVGTLSVSNLGALTVSSYAITADPDSKFAIDGTALETAAALDYETATSHSVTIRATLSDASTVSRTFTISVTDAVEALTISALILGQSQLEYLFNAGSFYRAITQPTPGNGNLIVFTQGAPDAAPVRTVVNSTTVAAGQVNPAMAAMSAFLAYVQPTVTFVVGDGSVAGVGRYDLVDDTNVDFKWSDLSAVVAAVEAETGAAIGSVIENWYGNDEASIATFKACFWPMYFGRTSANGAFTLGSTNPSAINTTAVFDHCLWDGAAATNAKGRGLFTRDATKWYITTPTPFVDAPVSPSAEMTNFSTGGVSSRLGEPDRATVIALASDTLAQSVNLVVGPSAHLAKFGDVHPVVSSVDGQIPIMWPIAINFLRQAGMTIGEPVISAVSGPSDGSYADVEILLGNPDGVLTTLRALRSASAPGVEPPHYQPVTGFEIQRGATRHPVYKTSETSYSADYRGTVVIQDSGSGSPRTAKVRITPTNAFAYANSISFLRGQATAVLLETRDSSDADLFLNFPIEHVPSLYQSGALYPMEGIAVRPYQAEITVPVPQPSYTETGVTTNGNDYLTKSVDFTDNKQALFFVSVDFANAVGTVEYLVSFGASAARIRRAVTTGQIQMLWGAVSITATTVPGAERVNVLATLDADGTSRVNLWTETLGAAAVGGSDASSGGVAFDFSQTTVQVLAGGSGSGPFNGIVYRAAMFIGVAPDITNAGVQGNFYNTTTGVTVDPATSVAAYGTPVFDFYGADLAGGTNHGSGGAFTPTGTFP